MSSRVERAGTAYKASSSGRNGAHRPTAASRRSDGEQSEGDASAKGKERQRDSTSREPTAGLAGSGLRNRRPSTSSAMSEAVDAGRAASVRSGRMPSLTPARSIAGSLSGVSTSDAALTLRKSGSAQPRMASMQPGAALMRMGEGSTSMGLRRPPGAPAAPASSRGPSREPSRTPAPDQARATSVANSRTAPRAQAPRGGEARQGSRGASAGADRDQRAGSSQRATPGRASSSGRRRALSDDSSEEETAPARATPRPPRPGGAHAHFMQAARARLAEDYPGVAASEIKDMARQEWDALDDRGKAVWEAKARTAKERWIAEHGAREASPPSRPREASRPAAEKRTKQKQQPNKPPPPRSAYQLFADTVREDRQREYPDMNETELKREISDEWKGLSSEEKAPYFERARREKDAYDDALAEWAETCPEEAESGTDREEGQAPEDRAPPPSEGGDDASEADQSPTKVPRIIRRRRGAAYYDDISDEEAEYLIATRDDPDLTSQALEPESTSMAALTSMSWRRGRARDKTWELSRVLRHHKSKGRYAMPKIVDSQPSGQSRRNDHEEEEEEEVGSIEEYEARKEGSDEESEEEEDDEQDHRSNADSHAPSEDHHTYGVGAAPQFRIKDGRMVLDQSSLAIERYDGNDIEKRVVAEVEEDDHRFVNSASRREVKEGEERKITARWTPEETIRFLDALATWGTDFETIARLFPRRTRKQIRNKWRREERLNPNLLEEAFNRRKYKTAVEYEQEVKVLDPANHQSLNLAGPPPEIEVKPFQSLEDEDEATSQPGSDWQQSDVDGSVSRKRRGSDVSAASDPKRRQRSNSASSARDRPSRRDADRDDYRSSMADRHARDTNEPDEEVVGTIDEYNRADEEASDDD